MTDTALARTGKPFFEITGLRFRLWPIALAALIMQCLLVPTREAARLLQTQYLEPWLGQSWTSLACALVLQALAGLIGIAVMRRVLPAADANLRWPPGRSYVGPAACIGVSMGLVMLIADYWPELLTGTAPAAAYDTSPAGASGWLISMAFTGVPEEIIFRGLLVGMLVVLVPGRVRAGRFEVPFAGVLVGVLFSLAHYRTFVVEPLHLAVAQQVYAFVWGLIYVWLMERSRSLLAPMVAHGLGNCVEVAGIMLLMLALSG